MPKYCSGCGTELKENSTFCDNCGSQITSEISPKRNKKIIYILAVVIVVVILIIAATMIFYQPSTPLSNLGYINNEKGFGLNPPAGWTTDTSGLFGSTVIFYGPTDASNFRANMNIVLDKLSSGITLSFYADSAKNLLNNYLTNPTFILSTTRTVNGMNAYEYVYTYTQGIYNIKAKQVIVEKNSKLVIISCGSIIDSYDDFSNTFEQCINSLKIV